MKTFSIVHVLLLLLLLLAYQCAQAQDYVITAKGDSIAGEVKPIIFADERKVQITPSEGKKQTFPIVQVKEFRFKDEVYHTVKNERGYDFMKLLRTGYLSVYAFQIEGHVTYDGILLVKRDGGRFEVPNIGFKKYTSRFLEDCPAIAQKIKDGEYAKKDLNQIVDDYNSCVQDRTFNHNQTIARDSEVKRKISPWESLEKKVNEAPDFEGKSDALEMIADVKGKISRSEKVPNFVLEGLKGALANSELTADLEKAIAELDKS